MLHAQATTVNPNSSLKHKGKPVRDAEATPMEFWVPHRDIPIVQHGGKHVKPATNQIIRYQHVDSSH